MLDIQRQNCISFAFFPPEIMFVVVRILQILISFATKLNGNIDSTYASFVYLTGKVVLKLIDFLST